MDLYIDRDALVSALTDVSRAAQKKHALMGLVLLEARPAGLRLACTDTELAIRSDVVANVQSPGELAVNAAELLQVVKSLPELTVHVAEDTRSRLRIACGKTTFRLPALPATEFPALQGLTDTRCAFTLLGSVFGRLVEQAGISVSEDEARYGLNGIHMEGDESKVRLVSTDGHRLSLTEGGVDGDVDPPERMLLPLPAMRAAARLADSDDEVVWSLSDSAMEVRVGQRTLWARLLEGVFPDYGAVLPDGYSTRVVVDRAALRSALQRSDLVRASKQSQPARFDIDEDGVKLSASSVDLGEHRETVEAEVDGESLEVGFSPTLMLDVLKAISTEQVVLETRGALSPCLVRGVGDEDARFVVMPMRVD